MGGIAAEILPLLRGEQAGAVLQQAAGTFQADTPDWMIGTEQLMVNHVFYEGFPYGTHQERPATAAVSLCAEYAVLRGTDRTCSGNRRNYPAQGNRACP